MDVDAGPELDLFGLVPGLMLLRLLRLFGQLVAVFAVINDTANWRAGFGGDFD
ncbi:MAG: hypothetical protein ACJASX_003296 [Limisphaerales bacterium]|jgi:hypothetical protein